MSENQTVQNSSVEEIATRQTDEDTAIRVRNTGKHANELDGKTWTKYSISVWSDIRKTQEEVNLGHPAIFPVALASRLIEIFTKNSASMVLDPFAGVGSTIVAAQHLGRRSIGIELSPTFVRKAQNRIEQKTLVDSTEENGIFYTEDVRNLLQFIESSSIDLVITSPPYWNILNEKRTADYKDVRNYGDAEADLGKIDDYQEFLLSLKDVFSKVYQVMRNGAYCCVIVMDIRKKEKFFPFHSDIATFMQEIGFIYDDIIIWDRRQEYNNMRPLGYPSVFRVNKAHEFILIFQKPKVSLR